MRPDTWASGKGGSAFSAADLRLGTGAEASDVGAVALIDQQGEDGTKGQHPAVTEAEQPERRGGGGDQGGQRRDAGDQGGGGPGGADR